MPENLFDWVVIPPELKEEDIAKKQFIEENLIARERSSPAFGWVYIYIIGLEEKKFFRTRTKYYLTSAFRDPVIYYTTGDFNREKCIQKAIKYFKSKANFKNLQILKKYADRL